LSVIGTASRTSAVPIGPSRKSCWRLFGVFIACKLEANKWITKPDVAWNEAWLVEQERFYRVEGDRLYIETAPQMNPNFGKLVRVTFVWQKEG
jgi:hypothetical protein